MRLIHCNQVIENSSLQSLLGVLKSSPSCLLLRQQGLQNSTNSNLIKQLIAETTVYLLVAENSVELSHNLEQHRIDQKQFVQLCAKATQLLSWK
jgi:hypothetical protein